MRLVHDIERRNGAKDDLEIQGLAGWILGRLRGWRREHQTQRKQMRLVETLALGGRRQLMLVSCGGEHFLVGGGVDSVETIVRVKADGVEDEICL
jgi:flagellar biogenesis protein FliO